MIWYGIAVLLGMGLIVAAVVWTREGSSKRRRAEFSSQKLTEAEWVMISRSAKPVERAPREVREKLEPIIQVLLGEKSFEACGGLEEVTREMKLVILAQAALLLVGRKHRYYPILRSILVYPDAYVASDEEGEGVRLGESWSSGSVVLAWRSVAMGGRNAYDGLNVVLHEFSHQLDQEDGRADGLPILADGMSSREWAKAFQESYENFCDRVNRGKKTVLDDYGATNPAEFFSVATETFFEKAEQLEEKYPELYGQLREYYGLDPARW